MPRYYCDYCDTYLTHDSPSVRKQHNAGYKHKANVRTYYQQYEAQLNQSLIDQKVKEHLGAFRPPPGVAYNPIQMRPGLMPMPLPGQYPLGMQFRPPVLPRPPGAPGGYAPPQMPQMVLPPGAPMPGQMNGLQRPGGLPPPPPMIPGMPSGGAPPPMFAPPPMYQGNVSLPTSGGSDSSSINNAQATEANQ
ncbi:hypothetical protein MIMGU_mgv1a020156mg [Erythranthe guttata]|uniref:U1 small nuclear ribonucleoprotein C n=1 Tax=Erythranthe guttata TaxID=4155 RepID=A0A022RL21_ERYGU|nr:PREDICTED: U1 small nuclear ribonucleoprotein C-like [Erythranthe guttata]EYU40704.1 hypothetical protein MIMGU_mgv1a020156mg [Erythranthe guttata]|eukprot:XP_012833427.1 PREDICTED: U1 small nuclear ribonucleoprotein C-like [Erythranthe guttata]